MSIQQTPSGTWQVRWRDVNGRQRAKNFKSRTAALAHERAVRTDTDRGLPTARPKAMSVGAWADQWLAGAHNLRPKTRSIYGETVGRLDDLSDVALGRLSADAIDDWLAARAASGAAPSSVHRDYRVLRRMLNVAHKRGHLLANPIDDVAEPLVPEHEMRFLTATELERLAAAIDPQYRTLVLVAGWGGLRWGEIAALTAARVDTKGGRVHVVEQLSQDGKDSTEPKTKAGRRWVTLPESVAAELADHVKGRAGHVWTMPGGGPLVHAWWRGTRGVRSKDDKRWETQPRGYWLRAIDAAEVAPLRFHDLRHTSVALAVAAGMHPRVIQARVGHASIEVTLRIYGHLFPGLDSAGAADLDRLRGAAGDD